MDFIFDPSLVLYLPLYKLDGSSLMSEDAYGHVCTVTGALWRPYGRHFDGDDCIALPISTAITSLASGAVEMWFYQDDIADDDEALIGVSDKDDASSFLSFDANTVGVNKRMRYFNRNDGIYSLGHNGSIDISEATWHHLVFQQTGSGYEAFVDAVQETLGPLTGGNVSNTDWISYIQDIDTIHIANRIRSGGTQWFGSGRIGEVRLYSRALNPWEIQHNYLATKWRYK